MAIKSIPHLVSVLSLLVQASATSLKSDVAAAECLTSRTYTVTLGDTCARIARAHRVPRGSLVWLNDVQPDCSDLRGMLPTHNDLMVSNG